eukprot:14412255-Heterocapsa_arctica.AAC.1
MCMGLVEHHKLLLDVALRHFNILLSLQLDVVRLFPSEVIVHQSSLSSTLFTSTIRRDVAALAFICACAHQSDSGSQVDQMTSELSTGKVCGLTSRNCPTDQLEVHWQPLPAHAHLLPLRVATTAGLPCHVADVRFASGLWAAAVTAPCRAHSRPPGP